MASRKQVTPEEFAAIAGDVSLEDAERYLKMGKNNLELALNYFFNKKDKTTKPPPEEAPKPMTLMQKLQEGGKKQAHVERLVKELTNDVPKASQNDPKKKSTAPTYTSPHGANSQKSSNAKQAISTVSKSGAGSVTKTVSKRGSETKTPDNKDRLENFFRFGSMSSQPETQKKIATPSTAISKGVIEEDRIEDISIDNMVIEDPKINHNLIASLQAEPPKNTIEDIKRLEEKAISEFKRHCSMSADLNPGSIEIETSGGDQVIQPPQTINKTKNFKRTFTQFSSIHEEGYDFFAPTEQIAMTIEDPSKTGKWPKTLGNLIVKGHVVCSLKTEVQVGDNLELKLEKPHVVEKKKSGGARSKANNNSASPPIIMRVLYNDQELGKLDTGLSGLLGQLIDKDYIRLEATLDEAPVNWSTFAQFYVNLKVLLLPSAISRPLTKVRSSHEGLSIEDEAILNELQQSKEAFMWLFESLGLQMKTPTLVKRNVVPVAGNQKSLNKKNKKHSQVKEEEDNKENEGEEEENNHQQQEKNIENELFKYLLGSDDFSCEELEPSQVISLLSLPIHQEEARVLTWMLLREGSNESQREVLYRKARILHPLWEEYILQEGCLLYFNPFTGQLSVETPKNTFDCSGGIIGNMQRGLKVQMVAGLVNANRFDKDLAGAYDPIFARRKNLMMIHGRSTLSNLMKGPLLPAGTLLIVPVNTLYFWESALSRLTNQGKAMKVLVYYGQKRAQEGKDLGVGAYDIVMTTYGIISGEFSGEGKKDLYNYEWFRVILDEAHYIKGKRIQTVKAIENLNMLNRWCLSGINEKSKLEDLYNMVNFLKIEPWNCLTWWNAHIGKPILEKGEAESFEIVKTILSPLALILNTETGDFGHRMATLSHIMEAEKNYKVEMVELSKEERDYYGCLYKKSKTEFDKLLGLDALAENHTQAYTLTMRIRYACDHLFLIYSKFEIRDSDCLAGEIVDFLGAHYEDNNDENGSKRESVGDELSIKDPSSLRDKFHDHFEIVMDESTRAEHVLAIQKPHAIVNAEMVQETVERLNQGDVVHCPICLNDLENAVVTICGHILCNVCEKKSIENCSMCPVCSTILTRKDCLNIPREIGFVFDISEKYRRSSKLEILMAHLAEAINAGKKCIVLSHFHPMLLLLEYDLAANEVNYLKVHAAMDQEKRIQTIQQFNSCGETAVLIATMVLGDVGTEKLMADNVFILEPSNDQELEEQVLNNILAASLDNRLDIMKFVCRNTIEEHILKLNEIKRDDPARKPLKNVKEKIHDCIQDLCYLMKQPEL